MVTLLIYLFVGYLREETKMVGVLVTSNPGYHGYFGPKARGTWLANRRRNRLIDLLALPRVK